MEMHKTGANVQLPVVTTMCSGITANPIRSNYGGGLTVKEIKVIGAFSNGIVGHTDAMTHAFIFNGELNVSVEYNLSEIKNNEIEEYCALYKDVLKYLTTSDTKIQLTIRDILKKA
ncbi:hypothetical protein RFI_30403 [Reticulomyxa filosa]|uniref:Uncharacterized protein n=1 Tax=Reticulomyxa filosa TaxID=46433 RepID=X6M1Y1_RETFI|nr:hypothetical protein RFI_30403 [Reticulomyxa filosa]|eukprot:ETO06990.1 hypothetical protein RFI_30403 [Reticulomyxa filosa]